MTIREKVTYQEKYKKHAASVKACLLPKTLPFLTQGTRIKRMEIRSAGCCELDGEKMEFQDIRVYTVTP